MRSAAVAVMMIASAAQAQSVPEAWNTCKTDSECAVVPALCNNGWLPVNVESKPKLLGHITSTAKHVKCKKQALVAKPFLECMDTRCVTKTTRAKQDKTPLPKGIKTPDDV